jgi:peptidoglycan/LPS O-acetylase OafA/YrhL
VYSLVPHKTWSLGMTVKGVFLKSRNLVGSGGPDDNNYDLLRVALALMVIVSHATPVAFGLGAREPLSSLLPGFSLGAIAVGGFFAISGYLVTASWSKSRPFKYLQKRSARILPGFVVACAITAALACATSLKRTESLHCTDWWRVVVTTITLRRPVVCLAYTLNPYPSETNASLWTIKYEVACYIATVFLGSAGLLSAKRRYAVLSLFIGSSIASLILGSSSLVNTPLCYAVQLGTFYAAGMTVYCFRDVLPRSRALTALSFVLLALSSQSRHLLTFALPSAGVYLLFRFVYADRVFAPALRTRVGDLSYGLYLYGWPIEQGLVATFGVRALNSWFLAAVSILVCLPIAYLSWHCVERPFLSMIPRT